LHTVYDYFGEEDFTKCCSELGIDKSYAKHVLIGRLKSSIFDDFWNENTNVLILEQSSKNFGSQSITQCLFVSSTYCSWTPKQEMHQL